MVYQKDKKQTGKMGLNSLTVAHTRGLAKVFVIDVSVSKTIRDKT